MDRCKILFICLLLSLFLLPASSYGSDYYVSASTGDDLAGDGSMAAPWASIGHAVSSVSASDADPAVIHVAQGLYLEKVRLVPWLSLMGGYDPFSWERLPRFYESIVEFIGNYDFVLIMADNSSIDGFTIRPGSTDTGINSYGKDGVNINNNRIEGSRRGVLFSTQGGSHSVTISNNYFFENTNGLLVGSDGTVSYPINGPCYSFLYCTCSGSQDGTLTANIENNVFRGNNTGLVLGASESCDFTYCIDCAKGTLDARVINNTIIENNTGIETHTVSWDPITSPLPDSYLNVSVRNSILHGNFLLDLDQVAGIIMVDYSNIEALVSGTGNINVDPQFFSNDPLNAHLLPTSPLIDSGDPALEYNDPDGSRNDIGAFGGPGAFFDSDMDGIADWYETAFGLLPGDPGDGAEDPDNDLLTNLEEFEYMTNPNLSDTDGDGLLDGEEVHVFGSSARLMDTDGDTLSDQEEVTEGLDGEVTDPISQYSDMDSIPDGEEATPGVDGWITSATHEDTDGDGMADDWEIARGLDQTDPTGINGPDVDPDMDGFTNLDEFLGGTDPFVYDDFLWRRHCGFYGDSETLGLGERIVNAGDMNGDTVNDFLAGASASWLYNSLYFGHVRLYSGANCSLLRSYSGKSMMDFFGYDMAMLGDIDGDTVADIAVGAPRAYYNGQHEAGAVYAVSGANGATLWQFGGDDEYQNVGLEVKNMPDMNGDGIGELLVSGPASYGINIMQLYVDGEVFLLSGSDGGIIRQWTDSHKYFGFGIGGGKDLNGDTVPDIATGVNMWVPNYINFYSGADGSIFDSINTAHVTGKDILFIDDVSGDGIADILMTLPASTEGSARVGLFSGADRTLIREYGDLGAVNFADRIQIINDIDGDGNKELYSNGMVFVDFLSGDPVASIGELYPGRNAYYDLEDIGDVDGDGKTEIAARVHPTMTSIDDRYYYEGMGYVLSFENDPDGDGLDNKGENLAGTRADNPDTDGGGELDGSEVERGSNPLDPADDFNVPVGSNVTVNLGNGVTITFFQVLEAGPASAVVLNSGPPTGTGFRLGRPPVYYDISTSAVYTGPIEICINYDESNFRGPEKNLRLIHFNPGGGTADVTTSLDIQANIVCGTVNHLSLFAVAEVDNGIPLPGPSRPPAKYWPIFRGGGGCSTARNSSFTDYTGFLVFLIPLLAIKIFRKRIIN